ncbi:MAG TPA: helix-turn-helix domain-containing protein [Acidimicrobiales bacterium]|nr:helix-turn-helix domain-containing protein [Acidimicrobiales bacterium]
MFEDLGLSPYETRVLLALLRTGSSNSSQLARLADVPRTSTYAVLESLSEKGLVHRLPGDGPSMWGTPGPDEVLERLESAKEAAQEEQLRLYRGRIEDARRLLAETVLEQPALSLPYVHFVRGAAQVKKAYEQLIGGAEREVLMFNRPPYTWDPEQVNPAVLDLLERGVETRVLYQAAQWRDAEAAEFRASHLEYHRAGVQARLVEALPIKLAIGDRRVALTGMRGSLQPVDDRGIPTNLLIEDPGMAEVLAHAFEHLWAEGEPV